MLVDSCTCKLVLHDLPSHCVCSICLGPLSDAATVDLRGLSQFPTHIAYETITHAAIQGYLQHLMLDCGMIEGDRS